MIRPRLQIPIRLAFVGAMLSTAAPFAALIGPDHLLELELGALQGLPGRVVKTGIRVEFMQDQVEQIPSLARRERAVLGAFPERTSP